MKKQRIERVLSLGCAVALGLLIQISLNQPSQAQVYQSGSQGLIRGRVIQTFPSRRNQQPNYTYSAQTYHQHYYQPQVCPTYQQPYYPQQQFYHAPDCPYANQGTIISGPIETVIPVETEGANKTVVSGKTDGEETTESETDGGTDTETVVAPVEGWDQWNDMPPLRGDFPEMIHQMVGDIDWLQVAHGDKFSPEVNSLLSEAKTNLETSCKVCDEDPDLFAGTESGDETVRDVTSQLKTFQNLLDQSLRQPEMQKMLDMVAPARADRSKIREVMGSLDAETKPKLFAMFAIETLKKRADQLVSHAEAVEQGTFRPVGVANAGQQLKVGDKAPDFSLQTVDGGTISLSDFKGKKTILVFNRGHF